jgi:hypothetical protein
MCVDISITHAKQPLLFDEVKDLFVTGYVRQRQSHQIGQRTTLAQLSQEEFTNHVRMDKHQLVFQQRCQPFVAASEMVDPNRRINQDHAGSVHRRRTALRPGSVPPRRASRLAASRSTSAVNAARSTAEVSFSPV